MRYFDTSFLVPLILPEVTSDSVYSCFRNFSTDELAVSDWTRVEIASLLARDVRMGRLDADSSLKAASRFESMILESFTILLPDRKDYNPAREWLCNFEAGLKSDDALHLAIAANRKATAIFSLDKRMVASGKLPGLPTSAGGLSGYGDSCCPG